jgi:hypothetical protein
MIVCVCVCVCAASLWVGTELIRASSHKQRIFVMQHFISIAEELLKLRNFEFALAILSGLKVPT